MKPDARARALLILSWSIAAFISCDFENKTEVYLQDLAGLFKPGAPRELLAPTVISFEVGSAEKCKEEQQNILAILGQYYAEVKNPRCTERSMKSLLQLDAKIPIMLQGAAPADSSSLVQLLVKQEGADIVLAVGISKDSYRRLSDAIQEKYYSSLEAKSFFLELDLINDVADGVTVEGSSVYMDGRPVPFTKQITLAKREKSNVKLSTVLIEHIVQKDPAPVLRIRIPGAAVAAPASPLEQRIVDKRLAGGGFLLSQFLTLNADRTFLFEYSVEGAAGKATGKWQLASNIFLITVLESSGQFGPGSPIPGFKSAECRIAEDSTSLTHSEFFECRTDGSPRNPLLFTMEDRRLAPGAKRTYKGAPVILRETSQMRLSIPCEMHEHPARESSAKSFKAMCVGGYFCMPPAGITPGTEIPAQFPVSVRAQTEKQDTIGDRTGPWYLVNLDAINEGWLFSGCFAEK